MNLESVSDLATTQGLRPRQTGRVPWQQVIRDRLRLAFDQIPRGERTIAAETGLGFPPSAYWYVGRCDPAFGRVAVVWMMLSSYADAGIAAAAPLDTGGVWHGEITLDPPAVSATDKAIFVAEISMATTDLAAGFSQWLIEGYPTDSGTYIRGEPPVHHVDRVVLDERNEPRAWTWELRMPCNQISDENIAPTRIFWTPEDLEEFERWMQDEDKELGAFEQDVLLSRVSGISDLSSTPATSLLTFLEATLV
jgi:hypothetical protein